MNGRIPRSAPSRHHSSLSTKIGFLKPRSSQGMERSRNEVDDPSFIFIQGTSVFGIQNKACLVVPVNVIQGSQSIPTNALIDSGAYDNFIDSDIAKLLDTASLDSEIDCRNVDGTPNKDGTLKRYTWIKVMMDNQPLYVKCKVANLGYEQIILGDPWLREHNPQIDWPRRKLKLARKTYQRNAIGKANLRAFMKRNEGLDSLIEADEVQINRMTLATQLAMKVHEQTSEKKELSQIVPQQYHGYLDVFQDFPGKRLPPKRTYDHAIDLTPAYTPQRSSPYSLSPAQQIALEDFLKENLAKGFIRLSKSPQAAPLFFVPKKNNKQRACMDYRYLNASTIRNSYPLPRAKDLMNKIGNAKVFMKLDLRNGYYNIRMKQGDEAKAAFVTPKGLYEPLVMFFGLCNVPSTFQAYMNDTFGDFLDEGWLMGYLNDSMIAMATDEEDEACTQQVLQRC